jgi:hypothetical protein
VRVFSGRTACAGRLNAPARGVRGVAEKFRPASPGKRGLAAPRRCAFPPAFPAAQKIRNQKARIRASGHTGNRCS